MATRNQFIQHIVESCFLPHNEPGMDLYSRTKNIDGVFVTEMFNIVNDSYAQYSITVKDERVLSGMIYIPDVSLSFDEIKGLAFRVKPYTE